MPRCLRPGLEFSSAQGIFLGYLQLDDGRYVATHGCCCLGCGRLTASRFGFRVLARLVWALSSPYPCRCKPSKLRLLGIPHERPNRGRVLLFIDNIFRLPQAGLVQCGSSGILGWHDLVHLAHLVIRWPKLGLYLESLACKWARLCSPAGTSTAFADAVHIVIALGFQMVGFIGGIVHGDLF